MKTTYTCLKQMQANAKWAINFYTMLCIEEEAYRYYKILNRIEASMWEYPSSNEFRRVEG